MTLYKMEAMSDLITLLLPQKPSLLVCNTSKLQVLEIHVPECTPIKNKYYSLAKHPHWLWGPVAFYSMGTWLLFQG
jgi:hypothetical protein